MYTLRAITDLPGCTHFAELCRRVWGDETAVVPEHVAIVVVTNGGGLIGVYDDDGPVETGGMVGAVFWWLGTTDTRPAEGRPRFKACSHVAGVLNGWTRRGIGLALKLAQRDALLAQGVTEHVTWTYDPLLRRNGAFNLSRLGATCRTYKRNVYGEINDALNGGPTDRCQVDWWLTSERVIASAAGTPPSTPLDAVQRITGAPFADPTWTIDERPLAVPVPDDILKLYATKPDEAAAWRLFMRHALERAFEQGYTLVDCQQLEAGWHYLLTR